MASQYQTISEKDIARGIDARSTENMIEAGFAEDLVNVDTNSNGFLSKRPGYQGYYGYLPIRITQIEHSGTSIIFTLDGSIDTTNIADSPIVVYGKLSASQSGDWSNTNNAEYYSSVSSDTRKTVTSGSNTLSVPESEHGNDTPYMFTQLVDSTSDSNNSYTYFVEDATQIDISATTYDIDFDYTAPSNSDPGKVFALIADKSAVAGTTYVHTEAGYTSGGISVPESTHNLNNFNILVQVYYNNGSNELEKVIPDSVTIDATTGDVDVAVTNSGGAADFYVILSEIGTVNTTNSTISASSTGSITFSPTTAFNYVGVYLNESATYTEVVPDSITHDATTGITTVSITNSDTSAKNYIVFWEAVTIESSTLTVTDNGSTSATYTDTDPQLTLWGISHESIYKTSTGQEGHVNHIDSYRSLAEERMVAGLGGNLFSAKTRSEAGSDYLIPTTNIAIENRVSANLNLAPLFETTGDGLTRSRGIVTDDTVSNNKAVVTAVSYVSSTTADYTLSFDSAQTLTGKIDTNDKFVIAGMGHSVWNGTWAFEGTITNDGTTNVTIRLTNTNAIIDTYDETGAAGTAACYTDKITLTATSTFSTGDVVLSDSISLTPSVIASSSTTIYVDGITEELLVVAGLRLFGKRTGTTFPVDAVTNFVVGDMCSITGYNQQVRITSISTANTTLTLDESVTLQDGATPNTISVVGRWIPVEAPTSADNLPDTTYTRYFDANNYISQGTLRSVMVADNMYLTNQADEVLKFDGTSLYQAGIFRWQPQLFAQLDTTTASITPSDLKGTVSATSNNKFTIGLGEASQFQAGDVIDWVGATTDSGTYTVVSTASGSSADYVFIAGDIADGSDTTGTITKANRVRYYFRLNAIDSNNNIIASAATGSSDFLFDITTAGQVHMRLVGFPVWGNYDYDNLELEVYRTAQGTVAPFYRVRTADIDFNHGEGYIDIVDSSEDEFLQDFDTINTALLGAELGTAWEQPLRAKYITTADNRLILANVKDYPELDIVMRKAATGTSITAANLDQKLWLFRKDSTDSGTTTNMVDRVQYEFVDGGSVSIYAAANKTFVDGDVTTGTDNIAITSHGFLTGHKVQLSSSGTLPAGLATSTDYYIIRVDDDNLKVASSMANAVAGTAVDITAAAGGGTHTIERQSNIDTTATNFTINSASHGLAAGDWIYMFHSTAGTDNELNLAGWFQIASATTNTFVVDFSGHGRSTSGGAAADVDTYVACTTNLEDIPVWLGTDGNYNQVGGNTIDEFTAMLRLANAINASMRMADTTLSSPDQTTFVPWMTANAGSEYGVGRLVVRQPGVFSTTLEVKTPAAITNANIFVGGLLKSASTEVSATTRVFPSRVLISYANYPEIFDAPFADQSESTSVVDVNSADGQEITGIIPFFGESVFGGGQAEGVLVVFKENSIYLLDINTRGLTKIQSRGLGCTAPYSIASTRDGIMFANEAGIYRLNRDQRVTYVGKYIERIWEDTVNKDQLAIMTGHHYGRGRQYKLSVPSGSATVNSLVMVYDHQREGRDQEFGAWTKYNNHAATGWANLGEDAFFGTTNGQVFSIRNLNESSDYRDDASAIDMTITYRALDFGAPGIRKIVAGVNSHFQLRRTGMSGTTMYSSEDLDGSFTNAGTFTFTKTGSVKAVSALSSLPRRRMQYLQLKYTNSTKDEDVVLAGIDFHVAGLPRFGLPQQNETT